MRLIVLLILISLVLWANGQERRISDSDSPINKVEKRSLGDGTIAIRQTPAIEQMMEHYVNNNKSMSGVEGYRIQLYSGTGQQVRQEAEEVRTKMLTLFPDENVRLDFNAPFMRVRVGSYRHKHEALPLLRKVKSAFPHSYVVRDPSMKLEEFNRK